MKYLTKLMFPFHLQYIYIVSYLNAHHHGCIMITVRHAWKWPGFKIQISQDTLHSVKLLLTSVGKVNLKIMSSFTNRERLKWRTQHRKALHHRHTSYHVCEHAHAHLVPGTVLVLTNHVLLEYAHITQHVTPVKIHQITIIKMPDFS